LRLSITTDTTTSAYPLLVELRLSARLLEMLVELSVVEQRYQVVLASSATADHQFAGM